MINRLLKLGYLGRQITLAFIIFGLALSLGLGIAQIDRLKAIDRGVLDDTLYLELANFRDTIETARTLGAFHSRTTIIHTAPLDEIDTLPEGLRNLPVGIHDVTENDRNFRVLVEELDGIRYIVMFNDTNINLREHKFAKWVWLGAVGALAVSALFGSWIAIRLDRPAQRLAAQLTRLSEQPSGDLDLSEYRDDEIGEIARRLKYYHTGLSDLLAREKEFAGNVSHELRTPVTAIGLAADVLLTNPGLTDKDTEKIHRIQRATNEMSELVDTFLVLSRIDDTGGQYSGCDLKPLIEEVIEQQRIWLGTKPVEICIIERNPVRVAAQPKVVSVLIANLVRNAFRYTNSGSITITLDGDRVSVEDTGLGIDAVTQEKMFERHARGNVASSDGAGLGLSIVKRICDRYNWSVRFTSKTNAGSIFTVEFTPGLRARTGQQP